MRMLLPEPGPLPAGGLAEVYDPGALPLVRGGFVVGVDGGVAVQGRAAGLHTDSDKAVFHALRGVTDAVLVGAGTVRAENYGPVRLGPPATTWRREHGRTADVVLAVVSRHLDLSPQARCFDGGRTIVITCASAPGGPRQSLAQVAEVLDCGDADVDLGAAIAALRSRGLSQILCEGGPTLLSELQLAGQLDELCLTVSPNLVGTAPVLLPRLLAEPVRLALVSVLDGGDGALLCRWRLAPTAG